MRDYVEWTGDNFDEVSNFVTSGVKYSESTRITNGEKKENKLLYILDEDSNWVPVDEGSYIWKNDNDTFYITDSLPDADCDYENDNDTDEDDEDVCDCDNCDYKDSCEDYSKKSDDDKTDDDYDLDEESNDPDENYEYGDENYDNDEPEYDYTEEQQKRIDFLTKELEELKGKITKINNLMGSHKWSGLSDTRRTMLLAQLQAMKNYSFWLDKRLNWEKNLGE